MILAILAALAVAVAPPSVQTILQRSVQANLLDWKQQPNFTCDETDWTDSHSKTYEDLMIDGSDYQRLIAVNGKPLSGAAKAEEQEKLERVTEKRNHESKAQRRKRVAAYDAERRRDHSMMLELSKAFTFKMIGEQELDGFYTYVMDATPKPGYQPESEETEILPGMEGKLWIDSKTYQWVKVEADTIHTVSIEAFLAQVRPGTRFELEKMPVGDQVWLPKHFAMTAHATILGFIPRNSSEDDTFSNCHRNSPDPRTDQP